MKILCIGRNYLDHIREKENEIPQDIIFFLKPDTALCSANEDFYLPDFSSLLEYECELVVKINKVGKCIPKEFAQNYYSHIALGIDFTLRDLQEKAKSSKQPWTLCKGFDYSAPISNFYPIEEFSQNVQNINFSLKKNSEIVQTANSSQMLHSVNEIIEYISRYITLKTGDIIFTGTPSGVGKTEIDDVFEGFIEAKQVFKFKVK